MAGTSPGSVGLILTSYLKEAIDSKHRTPAMASMARFLLAYNSALETFLLIIKLMDSFI